MELWMYDLIRNIIEEDTLSIELVVLNSSQKESLSLNEENNNINRFKKIKRELNKSYLFFDYLKWDKTYYKEDFDAFEKKDGETLLENIETISITPRETKFCDFIEGDDLIKIKDKELDVIIRFGFRILKGNIFEASKFGVWSYHHDDNRNYRGGPGLFWEVYENNPASGTILQILNEKLDDGKVIYRSISNTDLLSYHKNRNSNYWKTSTFILRRLRQLQLFGWDFIENLDTYNESISYNKGIYTFPNNKQTIRLHLKLFFRNLKLNYRNQFYNEHWEVFFKYNNKKYKIQAPKGHWYADPFPFKVDDKTYLFVEDFDVNNNVGKISCIEIEDNLKASAPVECLKEEFHLSYPHVFEYEGGYYMIPETKEDNCIRLYRALEFPYKWEFVKILIGNVQAVDTTLLFHDQKIWLFTNIARHGATTWEELYIYYSDHLLGDWTPHALNPVISDVRSARPAGNFFKNDKGEIFRPSQDCSLTYGYATIINRLIKFNETEYEEKIIDNISPKELGSYFGTHTFNKLNEVEYYDAKKWIYNKNYNFIKFFWSTIGIYHHRPIRLFIKHLLKILIKGR